MKKFILILMVLVTSVGTCWSQSVAYTIQNEAQVDSKTLQFDIYIQNTSAVDVQTHQAQGAILYNTAILNGGTLTATVVSSEMVTAQIPAPNAASTATSGIVKLAPRTPPGLGNGTFLSKTYPGTKLCRLQLVNTVDFKANTTANLTFSLASPYITKFFYYLNDGSGLNGTLTVNASNVSTVGTNVVLNPSTFTTVASGAGNWSSSSEWTGGVVPTTGAKVIVQNDLTIDQNVETTSLTIQPGAKLTVATGKTLTATTFNINSDATGTGSLIANGTVTGNVNFQRYLTGNQWHMISSPLSGQSIASFLTSNSLVDAKPTDLNVRAMKNYLEATDGWSDLFTNSTSGNLGGGNGYAVWPKADGTVTFSGAVQTGNVSLAVTRTPSLGYGWNCIGNPYTSAIAINTAAGTAAGTENFIDMNTANIDPNYGAIYVWEQSSDNYTIISLSDADAFYAQVGQGFFVKSKTGGGNISFTSALQTHQPSATFKSKTIPWPEIKLTASLGNQSNKTVIRFNNAMSHGLDYGYDAGIFKSGFDVYTRLVDDNGVDFGIQCLPLDANNEMVVPVGLESDTQGTVSLSADIKNLSSEYQVTLEDRKAGKFTPVGANGQLGSVQVDAKSKITDRFYLHIAYLKNATGISDLPADWQIYVKEGQICISGSVTENATVSIYDVLGKQMGDYKLQIGSLNYIPCSDFLNGVYMLNIKLQSGGVCTRKITVIN